MKPSTCMLSTVLLVLVCQLVVCLSHGYLLDNDVISNVLSNDEIGADYTDINVDDIGITDTRKRAQLSLTGGLRSLAHMVYGQRNSERSTHQNALLLLGKRNWRFPTYNFESRLRSKNLQPSSSSTSSVTRRRSQQLSVSGPLSALANMLEAEGRRRKQSESFNNRMKLLEIGKRSSKMNLVDLNPLDEDIRNDDNL
ncbi:uncharacterized protein LOC128549525 [Mercenaria mercenaria]|uniref:uncharacterized protein LOC128549525 n=1 Tax=Mercenaria mercenaria TaxID=6596 RepID=UPI00234E470F|nr:uncharacterized protein LOC128549525 [Mercenaria mercenaria]